MSGNRGQRAEVIEFGMGNVEGGKWEDVEISF